MDVFKWSLPFLAQKVMSMLVNIVQKIGDVDEQEVSVNKNQIAQKVKLEQRERRKNLFKAKLKSFNKVNKMFGILTSERENILKQKQSAHDDKLPMSIIIEDQGAGVKRFANVAELDAFNEKRPNKI